MRIKTFQDLNVWRKAHQLTLNIYKLTKYFPNEEKFGIIIQIRKSSASICSNIAEGSKKSTKDFIRFLEIARGSLEETKYHLLLSRDLQYCTNDEFKKLFDLSDDIGKMLYGMISKLRKY